jgi:ribosomal RNA-processing protein 1
LRTYLSSNRQFTKIELLKLWKGLFYCRDWLAWYFFLFFAGILSDIVAIGMWMSDRPRTQQRLVVDLADLLSPMEEKNFIPYLEAFWITIAREWNGVDVLRMDKFLLLVRGYLASIFRYLLARKWESGIVEQVMDLMKEVPLKSVVLLYGLDARWTANGN